MPGGWAESAGGFPAMTGNVPFFMTDVVPGCLSLSVEAGCIDGCRTRFHLGI